jgi:hypothetical protein
MAQSNTESNSIACGVPVFSRTKALEQFLDSVPAYVDTVYVADNGRNQTRDPYDEQWPFDLEVLHLEYDVGIGACRAAITDACTEPYLWIGDCDMAFVRTDDLRLLRATLEQHPGLGGISGWLIEGDTVRAGARDLERHGDTAIKTIREYPDIERSVVPFGRFEFIPQAGLFRTEVFDTYDYDPEVRASEHFDFFWGQRAAAEWEFASTPAVMIRHDRNIDQEYRENRGSGHLDTEITAAKWGIEDIQPGQYGEWSAYRGRPVHEELFEAFRRVAPPGVWLRARRVLKGVMG